MEYREIAEENYLEASLEPSVAARKRVQLRNIILMGIIFMLLSSASQTCSTVETVVINSIHDQYFNGTSTLGYDLLAVLNGVIAGSVWISQTIVSNIGPKNGMLIGGICYVIFVSTFIRPLVSTLFAGAVVLGVGQAILWTSEGVFLSLNSDKETIGRNSALFWALYQTSLLWGNLFFFAKVRGSSVIDDPTRYWIFGVLVALSSMGVLVIMALKYPLPKLSPSVNREGIVEIHPSSVKARSVWGSIKASMRLLATRRMLLVLWTFIYIGLEQTFWSNVYDSSLGYTKQFGEGVSRSLVGLSGVLVGVGEIFGSAVFGFLESRKTSAGRDPIVITGFLVHILAFGLVFINIPNTAPLGDTYDISLIQPNFYLALFCALLFGIGDSAFNTQIYSFLGEVYAVDSVPVFTLFQFIWGCTCCGAFFYATVVPLYYQLLILVVVGCISTLTFCKVEWDYKNLQARAPLSHPMLAAEDESLLASDT